MTLILFLGACATPPAGEPEGDPPARPDAPPEPKAPEPEPAPVAERESVPPGVLYEVLAGEIAGQHEDYAAAAHHYLSATRQSSDPAIAERATQIALYAGSNDLAQQAVSRLLELTPDSRRAHTTAVTLALHRDDAELAQKHLRELLALAEDPESGWSQVAQLLARAPEPGFARARMEELVAGNADSPHAWLAFSRLESHFEELEGALEHADRALELNPGWSEGLAWRGRLKLSDAEYEGAAADLEKAIESDPDNRQARLHYTEALRRLGRYDRAQDVLEALPQDPTMIETRASLAVEAQDWDLADRLYRSLLEHPEHAPQARFFLGQIAELDKRFDEALDWYSRVNDEGLRLDARIREAVVLAQMDRLEDALELLATLRTEGPESAEEAWLAEGRILADAGRAGEAFDAYERGMAAQEDESRLRYARALLAAEEGQVERAEADLRWLLERDPQDAHALNALGYTLADQTERYEEALELISRAYELEPDDPAIVDSMGWVKYRLGEHDRALEYLRRALDLQFDPEIAAHLGEVLWVTGQQDEAREVWQRALDRHPEDSDLVRDAMERLIP